MLTFSLNVTVITPPAPTFTFSTELPEISVSVGIPAKAFVVGHLASVT